MFKISQTNIYKFVVLSMHSWNENNQYHWKIYTISSASLTDESLGQCTCFWDPLLLHMVLHFCILARIEKCNYIIYIGSYIHGNRSTVNVFYNIATQTCIMMHISTTSQSKVTKQPYNLCKFIIHVCVVCVLWVVSLRVSVKWENEKSCKYSMIVNINACCKDYIFVIISIVANIIYPWSLVTVANGKCSC